MRLSDEPDPEWRWRDREGRPVAVLRRAAGAEEPLTIATRPGIYRIRFVFLAGLPQPRDSSADSDAQQVRVVVADAGEARVVLTRPPASN